MRTGLAPQLTLEAAILREGGFKNITSGSVSELAYVTLKGGAEPGLPSPIDFKDGTPDTQADHALAQAEGARHALCRRNDALSLARASDVEDPLRRLRPPRAREGMVAHRRRR